MSERRGAVRVEGATGTGCGQCIQGSVVSFLISFFLIFCLAKPDPAPLRVSTHTHTQRESVCREASQTNQEAKKVVVVVWFSAGQSSALCGRLPATHNTKLCPGPPVSPTCAGAADLAAGPPALFHISQCRIERKAQARKFYFYYRVQHTRQ